MLRAAFSKVSPEKLVIYEAGDLPKDTKRKRIEEASEEEKKLKLDDVLKIMRQLFEDDKEQVS